jgi:hypothetical protein
MTRSPQELYRVYSLHGVRAVGPTPEEARVLAQALMTAHAADYSDPKAPLHNIVVNDLKALYEVGHPEPAE